MAKGFEWMGMTALPVIALSAEASHVDDEVSPPSKRELFIDKKTHPPRTLP